MARYYIVPFLLPPGIVVAFLAAAGALRLVRGKFRDAALFLVPSLVLWGLSTVPASDLLMRVLEANYDVPGPPRGDVVVLLGGGVYSGAFDLSGRGTPAEEMAGRIVAAVRVQRRLGVPVIVSGGRVFGRDVPEAPLVGRVLEDLGVPADRIILEGESRDTWENAVNTAAIIRRKGFGTPVLVTSAFHMRRSVLAFRKAGVEVVPCPAVPRTWSGRRYGPEAYLPDAGSLRKSALALREYIGLAVYGLKRASAPPGTGRTAAEGPRVPHRPPR